jgi:hypothetical protein
MRVFCAATGEAPRPTGRWFWKRLAAALGFKVIAYNELSLPSQKDATSDGNRALKRITDSFFTEASDAVSIPVTTKRRRS